MKKKEITKVISKSSLGTNSWTTFNDCKLIDLQYVITNEYGCCTVKGTYSALPTNGLRVYIYSVLIIGGTEYTDTEPIGNWWFEVPIPSSTNFQYTFSLDIPELTSKFIKIIVYNPDTSQSISNLEVYVTLTKEM